MVTAKQEKQIAKRIGRALATQRSLKRFTQEQVAEFIGVEQETISRFERGATLPPLLRLVNLAELYDVPVDAFVRAGSVRPVDQSVDIVAALNELNDEDRAWTRELVIEMCRRLAAKTKSNRLPK